MDNQPGNGSRFDAAALTVEKDSTEIEIFNTKEADCPPTGIFIEVLSRDAKEFKLREAKIHAQIAKAPTRRVGGAQMSTKERVELSLALSVASVKSWRSMFWNGQELECNDANVRMVFEQAPLIREQVDATSLDRGNFSSR